MKLINHMCIYTKFHATIKVHVWFYVWWFQGNHARCITWWLQYYYYYYHFIIITNTQTINNNYKHQHRYSQNNNNTIYKYSQVNESNSFTYRSVINNSQWCPSCPGPWTQSRVAWRAANERWAFTQPITTLYDFSHFAARHSARCLIRNLLHCQVNHQLYRP